jgi:hypothetical protein
MRGDRDTFWSGRVFPAPSFPQVIERPGLHMVLRKLRLSPVLPCLGRMHKASAVSTSTSTNMTSPMEKNEIQYIDEKADSIAVAKPHQIVKIDNFQVLGLQPEDADFYINYSEEQRKRVIRKVR